jgi:hypothetical protein
MDEKLRLKLDLVSAESAWPLKVCCAGGMTIHFARCDSGGRTLACGRRQPGRTMETLGRVNCSRCVVAVRGALRDDADHVAGPESQHERQERPAHRPQDDRRG